MEAEGGRPFGACLPAAEGVWNMAVNVIMPQLGLTMTEGMVTKWHKAAGEKIAKGEVLVEIMTEKITQQIESPADGVVLAILVPEGATVPVKALLAVIGEEGERVDHTAPTGNNEDEGPNGQSNVAAVKASPAAKKLARESGVDLTLVTSTGSGGRLTEKDVLRYLDGQKKKIRATPLAAKIAVEQNIDLSGISKEGRIAKADVLAAVAKAEGPSPGAEEASSVPLAGTRKIIADRMSLSWHTAPHVNLTVSVDMSSVVGLNRNTKAEKKFSVTEMMVAVAARALSEYGDINASLVDGKVMRYKTVNIGVAVALDKGLIVPVIRDAQRKGLPAIRREIADLAARARQGGLLPEEVTGGTFTITNLGMFGVDHFAPIINPPESAILAVCRVVDRPVVVDGAVEIRPMANLCLSFDHRLIDGALAARFMAHVRELMEQPLLLL